MDIAEFTAARLDEDDAAAQAAAAECPSPWRADGHWLLGVNNRAVALSEDFKDEPVAHIARHGPDRELREVAASRLLLTRYERLLRNQERNTAALAGLATAVENEERAGVWDSHGFPDTRRRAIGREADMLGAMIPILRELIAAKAAVYSDHPDYRAEWKP